MKKIFFPLCLLLLLAPWSSAEENVYVNAEYGFSVTGPKGWHQQMRGGVYAVSYTPNPQEPFPVLSVILEDVPPEDVHSALDFSKRILSEFQKNYKTKVIEPPAAVQINGTEGARFVLEVENLEQETHQVVWTRNLFYQFMKKDKIVSLLAMSKSDTFEKYGSSFERTAQSFKWIKK